MSALAILWEPVESDSLEDFELRLRRVLTESEAHTLLSAIENETISAKEISLFRQFTPANIRNLDSDKISELVEAFNASREAVQLGVIFRWHLSAKTLLPPDLRSLANLRQPGPLAVSSDGSAEQRALWLATGLNALCRRQHWSRSRENAEKLMPVVFGRDLSRITIYDEVVIERMLDLAADYEQEQLQATFFALIGRASRGIENLHSDFVASEYKGLTGPIFSLSALLDNAAGVPPALLVQRMSKSLDALTQLCTGIEGLTLEYKTGTVAAVADNTNTIVITPKHLKSELIVQPLKVLHQCETPKEFTSAVRTLIEALSNEWAHRLASASTPEAAVKLQRVQSQLAIEQMEQATNAIASVGSAQEMSSEAAEAELTSLSSDLQRLVAETEAKLTAVRQEIDCGGFDLAGIMDIRPALKFLRKLVGADRPCILRRTKDESALIIPYVEGAPYHKEVMSNELNTQAGELVTQANKGKRILVQAGKGRRAIVLITPMTPSARAWLQQHDARQSH